MARDTSPLSLIFVFTNSGVFLLNSYLAILCWLCGMSWPASLSLFLLSRGMVVSRVFVGLSRGSGWKAQVGVEACVPLVWDVLVRRRLTFVAGVGKMPKGVNACA